MFENEGNHVSPRAGKRQLLIFTNQSPIKIHMRWIFIILQVQISFCRNKNGCMIKQCIWKKMEMWQEIAFLNVFLTLCHCNKHSSLIISSKVSAIFIVRPVPDAKTDKLQKWSTLETPFCSLSYCNSHVTMQTGQTSSEVFLITLCRNDFGKLNHLVHVSGQ